MALISAYCAQRGRLRGNIHVAVISNTYWRERITKFAAQQPPTFSIKGSSCKTCS